MKLLDPLLVDGSVLDRYLSRLAENTAQVFSRLEVCEKQLDLLRDEFEEIKNSSNLNDKKTKNHQGILPEIRREIILGKYSPIKYFDPVAGKVEIAGDLYGGCLVWKFQLGDYVKEGQIVAISYLSKNSSFECGAVGAPADGILVEKIFNDGSSLYGPSIVIGYIRTR